MSDGFIESLKADWDRQGAAVTVLRLRRRRWAPHALMAADATGALVMLGFGIAYSALAIRSGNLLFYLSAAALLPVGLPLVLAGIWLRWRELAWEGETAEGVLRSTLRRLHATRRVLQLGRAAALVLFALAAIVWACALAGLVREPGGVLGLITTAWIATGLATLVWIRWRLARTARELQGCAALLHQFEGSAGASAS